MGYPRFDNPLNPDIANPNVGDIAESVRCAVADFYIKRASLLRAKAEIDLPQSLSQAERTPNFDKTFCREPTAATKTKWRIAIYTRNADGKCTWKPLTSDPRDDIFKNGCTPYFGTYRYINIDKIPNTRPDKEIKACIPNGGCPPGMERQPKQKRAPGPHGLTDEDDIPEKADGEARSAICVIKDEKNRFALDPNGKAKIELTLQAVNSLSMNYAKIDASSWHSYFIVPGNSLNPFPSLKASDKSTNKVEVALTMPQANSVGEKTHPRKKEDVDPANPDHAVDTNFFERLAKLKQLRDEVRIPRPTAAAQAVARKSLSERKGPSPVEVQREARRRREEALRRQQERELAEKMENARRELTADAHFYEKCGQSKINFLALSDYLTKIVSEREQEDGQERNKGLDASLDSIVLTSQFQITLDASAGTQHLLRIVPVVQPPILGLSPDHTHTLKLTFSGRKGRAFDNNAKTLIQKCLDRFKGLDLVAPGTIPIDSGHDASKKGDQVTQTRRRRTIEEVCNDPRTVLLESLIEAVDNSKSGGSSN